jgi:hypothetical protein
MKKSLLSFFFTLYAIVSIFSQSVTTVVYSFRIVNDFGKSLTCKQFYQTDYIRNDTLRYIKIIFQDQAKTNNNGYVILNSPDKLQQFLNEIESLKSKIGTDEVITLVKSNYKLDINNPESRKHFQKNLNLRVCIYEPNSTAFIGLKADKLQELAEKLEKVNWQ